PEGYEDAGSPHDGNARTRRASERYVILTSSSKHEDADTIVSPKTTSHKVDYPNPHMHMGVEDVDASVVNEIVNTFLPENDADAASLPGSGAGASSLPKNRAGTSSSAPNDGSPIDYFFECQTIDTATAQDIYVPHWDASLRNRHDADFLDLLNVNSAQHAYMVSELCLRDCFFKAIVEKAKGETAKVIGLRKWVFELEVAVVTKLDEVASLTAQNAELLGTVSGLELVCDGLKNQVAKLEVDCESLRGEVVGESKLRAEFMSVQDAEAQLIAQLNTGLDAHIVELNHDMDTELYPHMLTAVAGHMWMIGHGLRLAMMKRVWRRALSMERLVDHWRWLRPTMLGLKLITVLVYYERGGSKDPRSISHEILLSDALAVSRARCEKHKKAHLEIGGPSVVTLSLSSQGTSLAATHHHVSRADNVNDTFPFSEPHDYLFDATILDKPMDS
ncbi:hypothetical protein Tco_1388656, partial [Tanacetum coccineum]